MAIAAPLWGMGLHLPQNIPHWHFQPPKKTIRWSNYLKSDKFKILLTQVHSHMIFWVSKNVLLLHGSSVPFPTKFPPSFGPPPIIIMLVSPLISGDMNRKKISSIIDYDASKAVSKQVLL